MAFIRLRHVLPPGGLMHPGRARSISLPIAGGLPRSFHCWPNLPQTSPCCALQGTLPCQKPPHLRPTRPFPAKPGAIAPGPGCPSPPGGVQVLRHRIVERAEFRKLPFPLLPLPQWPDLGALAILAGDVELGVVLSFQQLLEPSRDLQTSLLIDLRWMIAPEHLTASKPPRLVFQFLLRAGLLSFAAFSG